MNSRAVSHAAVLQQQNMLETADTLAALSDSRYPTSACADTTGASLEAG
jgi:hypothetical protein